MVVWKRKLKITSLKPFRYSPIFHFSIPSKYTVESLIAVLFGAASDAEMNHYKFHNEIIVL